MDKILKFLQKRTSNERQRLMEAVERISCHDLKGLDIKKLKGDDSFFRVRIGNFRIIFERIENENFIRSIAKRDDRTYGDF